MELLLAFAIGWAVGAKGGEQGYRDVIDAARDLRRSDEFHALLDALRSHLAGTLRVLADVLAETEAPLTAASVVERVARMTGSSGSPTSSAS